MRVSRMQSARTLYDNDLHKFQLQLLRAGPRYINKNFRSAITYEIEFDGKLYKVQIDFYSDR